MTRCVWTSKKRPISPVGAAGPSAALEYFWLGYSSSNICHSLGLRMSYLQCISVLTGLNLHNLLCKIKPTTLMQDLEFARRVCLLLVQITADSLLPTLPSVHLGPQWPPLQAMLRSFIGHLLYVYSSAGSSRGNKIGINCGSCPYLKRKVIQNSVEVLSPVFTGCFMQVTSRPKLHL